MRFDGIDDALRVPGHAFANPGFTLSFWFRMAPPPPGATGYRYLVSQRPSGAPSSLQVYFDVEEDVLRSYTCFANDRVPARHLEVPDSLMDSGWHHFALSAQPRGRSFVAIDGAVRAENPHAGDRYDAGGAELFFGGRSDLDPDRFFPGDLDDIQLFSRALTPAELRVVRDRRLGAARPYGFGCPLVGAPDLTLDGRLETNRQITFRITGQTGRPAFLAFGSSDAAWSGGPLPHPLTAIGAPRCFLWQDMAFTVDGATGGDGIARFPLRLPARPSLVGTHLFAQGFLLGTGSNPLGLSVTHGLSLQLGGVR
jgi:hypothetical protein